MGKINLKEKSKMIFLILSIIIIVLVLFIVFFKIEEKTKKDIPIIKDTENSTLDKKEESELLPSKVVASVPIFMYHFILDDYGNYPDVENFLKPETLEEQIKYIVDNGYETIFENEIEKLYKYKKPVMLTFDDCFVYFYNNAFPLVKKYNVKVTLNLIYDYINGENYLTDDQIKEMLESGLVSIESHTLTHRELTKISSEEERKEILESKENFEKKFGIELSTICYPVGDYNSDTIAVAKEKYKYGLAMTGGVYYSNIHTDLYKIPRIYANRSMSINTFANYLSKSKVEVTW